MYQETLILLKPDALERNLIGEIIKSYEEAGLEVKDLKHYQKVDENILSQHYPDSMALRLGKKARTVNPEIKDPACYGSIVLERLRKYVARGPVLAIKMGGEEAINEVRSVTGYTDPATAKPGTIRRDLGIDTLRKSTEEGRAVENLVHASGDLEEAKRELALWFS